MGFFSQEYCSRLLFTPPGDFPGIKPASPMSPTLQADSLPTEPFRKALPICDIMCYLEFLAVGKVTFITEIATLFLVRN